MIYLVEDEKNIRDLVIYTLNNSGFEAKGFENGVDFFKEIKVNKPQLILLDIMLPGEDGISILKKIRDNEETGKIPVMMLTAKSSEYDKVIGLDMGADDYMTKPFGMMELVARVKALIRRLDASGRKTDNKEKEYKMDKLVVNVDKHRVYADGEEIILTYKEFELLCYFFENREMVLSRDKILSKIWGYNFDGETRTVDVHVRTLRQKLKEAGGMIETVRGVGYRMKKI